jgi:hypothetical protein
MPSRAASRAMPASSRAKLKRSFFEGQAEVLAHFVAAQHAAHAQRDTGPRAADCGRRPSARRASAGKGSLFVRKHPTSATGYG